MPITFRLRRDHLGAPYSSEINFVAIGGAMEIGGVSRDVFSDQTSKFRRSISAVDTTPVMGWADTVDDAKAALKRAWLDWVARAGLKDDPDAPSAPAVQDRGRLAQQAGQADWLPRREPGLSRPPAAASSPA